MSWVRNAVSAVSLQQGEDSRGCKSRHCVLQHQRQRSSLPTPAAACCLPKWGRMSLTHADSRSIRWVSTAVITVPLQLLGVCTTNLIEPRYFGITQVFTVAHNEAASEAERLASAAVSGRNSAAIVLGCSAPSARDIFGGKAFAGLSTCCMCLSRGNYLHHAKLAKLYEQNGRHINC